MVYKSVLQSRYLPLREICKEEDIFGKTKITADSGFHTEENMKMIIEEGIDGYIADRMMRKRDPRFQDRDRFKERAWVDRARREGKTQLFKPSEFIYNKQNYNKQNYNKQN